MWRYKLLVATLAQLQETLAILDKEYGNSIYYRHFRHSAIRAFEFCVEETRKFFKTYLVTIHKVNNSLETAYQIYRAAVKANLINEQDFYRLITITTDRNQTLHTYDEFTAEVIVRKLPEYYLVIKRIIDAIQLDEISY